MSSVTNKNEIVYTVLVRTVGFMAMKAIDSNIPYSLEFLLDL